jgi:hypothetical protein
VEDPICPMCGKEAESGFHALWRCPLAQTLWAECPTCISKFSSSANDVLSLMGALFQQLDREEMKLVVMVAQGVWFRRNMFVFEGLLTPPMCSIKCAKESLDEYRKTTSMNVAFLSMSRVPILTRWSKPPVGFVKLNWDAAVDRSKKMVGLGIIAHDSSGIVVVSMCSFHLYVSDSFVAKAMGARQGVEFGRFLCLQSVMLEGDSLEVVLSLQHENVVDGYYSNQVLETKAILQDFMSATVHHVGRMGNQAAHSLARHDVSNVVNHVWFSSVPLCLSNIVSDDLLLSDHI